MSSILIITSETFPATAGDGRSAFYLAQEINQLGHRCDILSLKTFQTHKNANTKPTIYCSNYYHKSLLGNIWSRILFVFELITTGIKYDTWLIYGKTLGNRTAILLGKILGKTTIFRPTLYGFDDLHTLSSSSNLNRIIYRLPKGYWALNPTISKSIIDQKTSTAKIFESTQGVPTFFNPPQLGEKKLLRDKLNLPNDRLIIVMVGHVIQRKGFPQIFRELKGIKEQFLLLVIGTHSPEEQDRLFHKKNEMEAIVKEGTQLLRSKVRFIGVIPNVADYLKSADIFLHASNQEGFPPNALNEAMATGLPCLVKSIKGIQFEKYINSIMIYRDSDEFQREINHFFQDNFLREKMGENALKFAKENLNLTRTGNGLLEFITSLERANN